MKFHEIIFSTLKFSEKPSAWIEHCPFAFFLIEKLRPKVFVELGTHYGVSYFSFCQAIDEMKIPAKAYAVDLFTGDEHAGYYDQEVFNSVSKINNDHFPHFSNILKSSFDEANQLFENSSIDLLHIDGLHTYEAVKHDFDLWLPKMSETGVIVFHDTAVKERGFGVWKLMDEIRTQYPSFEFMHGYGLGVVCVGADTDPAFLDFVQQSNHDAFIPRLFESLGQKLVLAKQNDEQNQEISLLKKTMAAHDARVSQELQLLENKNIKTNKYETEIRKLTKINVENKRGILQTRAKYEKALADIKKSESINAQLNNVLAQLTASWSWRITKPLRILNFHPLKHLKPLHKLHLIKNSGLFDAEYYLQNNHDVKDSGIDPAKHYLLFGGIEGRSPSPAFDSAFYLAQNPDVKNAGVNPLLHYVMYGKKEGRIITR